jgi:hypothetical protein
VNALPLWKKNYPSWHSALTHIDLFIASLCTFSLYFEVAYMLRLRDAMKKIGGTAWLEGQMGFGQVLALLLWMPVVVVFIFSLGNTHTLIILKRYLTPLGGEYLKYRTTR